MSGHGYILRSGDITPGYTVLKLDVFNTTQNPQSWASVIQLAK